MVPPYKYCPEPRKKPSGPLTYTVVKGANVFPSWPWISRRKYNELREERDVTVRTLMDVLGANQRLRLERKTMICQGIEYQKKLEDSIVKLRESVTRLEERLKINA